MRHIDPMEECRKAWDKINVPATEEEMYQYAISRGRSWSEDAEKIIEDRRRLDESGLSFTVPKPEWKCGAGTLDCLSNHAVRLQPGGEWLCSHCRKPVPKERIGKIRRFTAPRTISEPRILRNLP